MSHAENAAQHSTQVEILARAVIETQAIVAQINSYAADLTKKVADMSAELNALLCTNLNVCSNAVVEEVKRLQQDMLACDNEGSETD